MADTKTAVVEREPDPLFMKIATISSIALLVLSILLYMILALEPVAWVTVTVLMVLFIACTAAAWKIKGIRILVRSLVLLLTGGVTILALVSVIMGEINLLQMDNGVLGSDIPVYLYLQPAMMIFTLFEQLALVSMLPVMVAASRKGHYFDIVTMRVMAIMELIVGLFSCFSIWYGYRMDMIVVTIQNDWAVLLYGLVVALASVSCFVMYPIRWRPKWYTKYRNRMEAKKAEKEAQKAKDEKNDALPENVS